VFPNQPIHRPCIFLVSITNPTIYLVAATVKYLPKGNNPVPMREEACFTRLKSDQLSLLTLSTAITVYLQLPFRDGQLRIQSKSRFFLCGELLPPKYRNADLFARPGQKKKTLGELFDGPLKPKPVSLHHGQPLNDRTALVNWNGNHGGRTLYSSFCH
jgi:hypothetical protein